MASPLPCKELWHSALVNYGLERPSENTEIHVFRVILGLAGPRYLLEENI